MKKVLSASDAVRRADQVNRGLLSSLRPLIMGPRAALHRYSEVGERALLATYDILADHTYAYPGKATGSTVDLSYVSLYASTADLNYFNKYVGSNGSCQPSSAYPNRVRAANYVFQTANGTSRSADFYDRDVKVGDIVYVRGNSGGTVELTTSVTGFIGETVAAVTAAATSDTNNPATQIAAANVTQTADTPINDVVVTVDGSAYDSVDDGYINRTYTVTVTQSSTGGDATTGRLRVRSSDGLESIDNVVPATFGSPTTIGTKGLTLTFDIDSVHSSASLFGIAEQDFVVGQQWVCNVSQAFTKPAPTSAGTYTGTQSTTYVVTVSLGGTYSGSQPQITITSSNGYDQSGPTTVTAAATPVAIGNYGVTVAFSGTKLRKGDKYYVVATAASSGAIKTLVLKDDVPAAIRGTEVDLRLFARRTSLSIPKVRTVPTNATNWSLDANGVTVKAAIKVLDSEFTDSGTMFAVPIENAILYVNYREWVTDGAATKVVLNRTTDVAAALGTVTPDNPLAYAAYQALLNTAGELEGDPTFPAAATTDEVMCLPLGGDPTTAALWTTALQAIENEEDAYQLVPLTTDATILNTVRDHVEAQSTTNVGFYRVAWVPSTVNETAAIVSAATSTDDEAVTATIATNGAGQFTIVTASANAQFVTNAVRAGDTLRINYGVDAFGTTTYDSYTVASVTSQTTLVLSSGPVAAITVGVMCEVWRTYTKDELVTQLTSRAAALGSDRVRMVWPDTVGFGGVSLSGYHLCASLAGLAGSIPSHQGLANVSFAGVDDVTRSSRYFTNSQLASLAVGGVFVVTQTPDGVPYVFKPYTTDPTSASTQEESIVRNADMLRKAVLDAWAVYIGSGNMISNIRQLLDGALVTLVNQLKSANNVQQLGPPIANLSIDSLMTSTDDPRLLDVTLNMVGMPAPLNQIRLSLPITV